MAYSVRPIKYPPPKRVTPALPAQTSYPVVVKCLSTVTKENDLFHLFKSHGRIIKDGVTVKTHPNGQSTGMAFVNYATEDGAAQAMELMNGQVIQGSRIVVEPYTSKVPQAIVPIKTPVSVYIDQIAKQSFDYRPLTDCEFFLKGNCTKQNCLYRHPNENCKREMCSAWDIGTCKNKNCLYAHPKKIKETKLECNFAIVNKTPPTINLKENTPIEVTINSKEHKGLIRWTGVIKEIGEHQMAGIELENEIDGGNNGEFQGKRYFHCPVKRGYFIKATDCRISKTPTIMMIKALDALSMSKNQKPEYICGYYLKNSCLSGEKCQFLHPPNKQSYCWYYQIDGETEVKVCPHDINKAIDKAFRDVNEDSVVIDAEGGMRCSKLDTASPVHSPQPPAPTTTRSLYSLFDNINDMYQYVTGTTSQNQASPAPASPPQRRIPALYEKDSQPSTGNSSLLNTSQICVNFNDLSLSSFGGEKATFKRISTKSDVVAPDEPRASKWLWFWFDDVNWQEYSTDGQVDSIILETDYNNYLSHGINEKKHFQTGQFQYELSFKKMTQKNLKTSKVRLVRRRPRAPVKKSYVAQTSIHPVVVFPDRWKPVAQTEVKLFSVSNDVRSKIEREFFKTMRSSSYTIISVEEICNKALFTLYSSKKQVMRDKAGGDILEKQLWHGTKHEHVESICHQNFDWRLYSTHAFGKGSYFARDALYSSQFTSGSGVCSMFYADVLVGSYARGYKVDKRPPVKSGHTLYDSCVNNINDPSLYVIFEKDQCYPKYLLKYKRSVKIF